MRRLSAIIAPLAAIVMVLGLQVPGQASMTRNKCHTVMQDERATDEVCMVVKWHAMAGAPGISVDRLTISFDGLDMQSVDCYWVKLVNDSGVTKWIKQGIECDLPHYPPYLTFVPSQDMPQSSYADLSWSGHARLGNGIRDEDFTITIRCDQ